MYVSSTVIRCIETPADPLVLFAGRLADLYPPHRIYTIGFVGIAVFYLIISFMEDSIAFYVLRSISALFAVLTIPSAINMIGMSTGYHR